MTIAERRARAHEMMRTNRYTLRAISREVQTCPKVVRRWAREIGWTTPPDLVRAIKSINGQNARATMTAKRASSRAAVAAVMSGTSLPPQARTVETLAAQARATEHARRCSMLPPVTADEADALVAQFLAQREPTRLPLAQDYSQGNNFGEGWG